MTLPRLALSVIGDEIGPSLEEMISFAHEHGLKRLDMRTVGGRNLLGMTTEEVIDISRTLEKAGITVPTFVSPAVQVAGAGQVAGRRQGRFRLRSQAMPGRGSSSTHAIEIAVILGAPHMRIFSYLRYDRLPARRSRRAPRISPSCMGLAGHYDISLQLENEPVCNIGNIAELAAFFIGDRAAVQTVDSGRATMEESDGARRVLDRRQLSSTCGRWSTSPMPGRPANGRATTTSPSLAPLVTAIHLKDRDLAARPHRAAGRRRRAVAGRAQAPAERRRGPEVLASIETHCPQDGRNATARSIAGLRRIAAEIGVEVV